ncbi:MAG: hypothetical protein J0G35_09550 [Acidobacteriales bacterium]|nr:hypothetical protein [Terriglobales bacterium]
MEEMDEDSGRVPTLIRRYGEFWNPDLVNWRRGKCLLGKESKSKKSLDINVWNEKGVYVLYKEYLPVYVGKAFKQSIGRRLQLHRDSRRKGPRWDSFSWFGIEDELQKSVKISDAEALIETLEALLIVVIDPRLNSRREKLKGATHFLQSQPNAPLRDTDDRLEEIERKLDSLIGRSKGK